MKNLIKEWAVVAVVVGMLALTLPSYSQGFSQSSSPNVAKCVSAFNSSDVIIIQGNTTSNFPTTLLLAYSLGANGLGFGASVAGTNAATTTNATFTIEVSGNGTDYALNNRLTASVAQLGTGYSPFFTNIVPTTANIGNAVSVRLRSCQNTNIDSIFITNAYFNTR